MVYIEGIGYCREIVINHYNQNGINEPYTMYVPI
jgi:hypothetical protein